MPSLPQSRPDVYMRKAIATRKRRAAHISANKETARRLQDALNAHAAAVAEARRNGTPAPYLSDFVGGGK